MKDDNLHFMLARLFQHTKSMRISQRNLEVTRTKYDKKMVKMLEKQVDIDIINIDAYLRDTMTPSAPPPS